MNIGTVPGIQGQVCLRTCYKEFISIKPEP